mmetsp:Transcript_79105/g.228760  ORF Transcript_79105/g.228760 Transcript_79105/m.228760 type:complete len:432 (+) Transcript_79105:153-1448(+)
MGAACCSEGTTRESSHVDLNSQEAACGAGPSSNAVLASPPAPTSQIAPKPGALPSTSGAGRRGSMESELLSPTGTKLRHVLSSDSEQLFSARGSMECKDSLVFAGRLSSLTSRTRAVRLSVGMRNLPSFIDPNHGLRDSTSVKTPSVPLEARYSLQQKLGSGSFGTVHKVKRLEDGQLFALKSIPLEKVEDFEGFERELFVMRKLQHPYIVRLHEFFHDRVVYHLVMDLCMGGDLFEPIANSKVGLDTRRVARYAWQMLNGIAYIHGYHFAHRDIKPENYLLVNTSRSSPVRLIDFGISRSFERGEPMTTLVGTPEFMAPEILTLKDDGYDEKVDVWSLGVTIFVMATANYPFFGETNEEVLIKVKRAAYTFDEAMWARHPEELRDLIRQLLQKKPPERPHAKTVLESNAWLQRFGASAPKEGTPCCPGLF